MPDKIVNMLKVMEREAKPVPGSFKVVEQLSHPEDYQKLVNNYMEENKRTVEKVRWHTERIVRERWWRWTLLHPDLGPDRIHPSRSMPSPQSFLPPPTLFLGKGVLRVYGVICRNYDTLLLSLTENIGEIKALNNGLLDPKDIAIKTEKWQWAPQEQWPPIDCVLRSKFWCSNDYKYLRDRLKEPLVEPEVSDGAQYSTINLQNRKWKPIEQLEPTSEKSKIRDPKVQGVCHVIPFKPNCAVPEDLRNLKYKLIFWEVNDGSMKQGIHTSLQVQVRHGVPLLLGGGSFAVRKMAQMLKEEVTDRNLNIIPTYVFYSEKKDPIYGYGEFLICFISLDKPDFKVSTPSPSPCTNMLHVSELRHGPWIHQNYVCFLSRTLPCSFTVPTADHPRLGLRLRPLRRDHGVVHVQATSGERRLADDGGGGLHAELDHAPHDPWSERHQRRDRGPPHRRVPDGAGLRTQLCEVYEGHHPDAIHLFRQSCPLDPIFPSFP